MGNYKSFHRPHALDFTRAFNIVSGQNNAGKTALLEALGLNFEAKAHRSTRTLPARDTIPDLLSWAEVSFTLPANELKEFMRASGLGAFRIAKPSLDSEFARNIGFRDDSTDSVNRLLEAVFSADYLTVTFRAQVRPQQPVAWTVLECPSYGLYPALRPGGPGSATYSWATFVVDHDGQLRATGNSVTDNSPIDFGVALAHAGIFQRHVYRFSAERMNVGQGSHGVGTQLLPNAGNLPEVLNQLQHNTSRFAELNRTLSGILPQVKQVSVRATKPGQVEIVVWPHDPDSQREDLAVPLSESGTGIGQVLAILYVVMTSNRPQVIIIDEPQSFLHPGAARKLVEFLSLNQQHQFIMATHSPTIIAAADPRTITLVRYEDGQSVVEQLDAKKEKGIQAALAEVGVRLSDSFGADNILWVEGRTEEKCYRLIIEKLLKLPLKGTEILGIRRTGDLESKDAKKVLEIYRSLTESASLLPPAIAFVLDQECRGENAKRELRNLSNELVRFLPRRMYENYLLNAEAVAAVVGSIPDFAPEVINPDRIREAIEAKLRDRAFHCSGAASLNLNTVDGAHVLGEIFSRFSETRVSYQKVAHGIALTEWLIEHRPEDLADVRALLEEILGGIVVDAEEARRTEAGRQATA